MTQECRQRDQSQIKSVSASSWVISEAKENNKENVFVNEWWVPRMFQPTDNMKQKKIREWGMAIKSKF